MLNLCVESCPRRTSFRVGSCKPIRNLV